MFKDNFMHQIQTLSTSYFQNMGFDQETIDSLIAQGLSDLEKNVARFERELSKDSPNLKHVADVAHTIKGILGNLGLEEQAALFAKIEKLTQTNQLEEIKTLLKKI